MTSIVKNLFFLASIFCIGFFSMNEAETKSSGSPLANTGSPGDGANNTCAKAGCHFGTVNSFPGSVTIDVSDIPSSGYSPGQTYSISVTVAEAGRSTFGFQLTAEDASGNKVGSYTGNNQVRLEFTDWVTHRMNSGTGVWSFDWTAPSGVGDITFYAAGNAANGNGSTSGDHIYTGSATVSLNPLASVNELTAQADVRMYGETASGILFLETKNAANFEIYDMRGAMVNSFRAARGNNEISIHDLQPGSYIITSRELGYSARFLTY